MNVNDSVFRQLVTAATRAPSGHNSQPWRFHATADGITILPDPARTLPAVDGDQRELLISLGCALENLCLHATTLHYTSTATIGADGRIDIHLRADDALPAAPLAASITRRQTNRATCDGRMVPDDVLQILLAEATANIHIHAFARDTPAFTQLGDAIRRGNDVQMNDPAFKNELLSWIRYNRKHSEAHNDGISNAVLGAPNLPRWLAKIIVKSMMNGKTQNKTDAKHLAAASHLLLISSDSDDNAARIATGRVLQRLLLRLSAANLACAFLNQPCEVAAIRAELRETLPISHAYPQILLRIGYAAEQPYSLRRPVEEVIMTTT